MVDCQNLGLVLQKLSEGTQINTQLQTTIKAGYTTHAFFNSSEASLGFSSQ